MNTTKRYSPEVRERAVRMVLEHQAEHSSQWATIESVAAKIGSTAEALRRWVRQALSDTSPSCTATTQPSGAIGSGCVPGEFEYPETAEQQCAHNNSSQYARLREARCNSN